MELYITLREYEFEVHAVKDMTKQGGSGMFVDTILPCKFDFIAIYLFKYTKKENTCWCNNHYEGICIWSLEIPTSSYKLFKQIKELIRKIA